MAEKAKKKMDNQAAIKRKKMLAAVHIGQTQLGLEDELYRDVLDAQFGVRSAGKLTMRQLGALLDLFRQWGAKRPESAQVAALQYRAREMAAGWPDGAERLQKLTLKLCGVARLEWARDIDSLTRLLAAMGKIEREYGHRAETE